MCIVLCVLRSAVASTSGKIGSDRSDSASLPTEVNVQHPDVEDERTRHEPETGKMGLMVEIICRGSSVAGGRSANGRFTCGLVALITGNDDMPFFK